MKVSKEALRRIVREAVQAKLQEVGRGDPVVDQIGVALTEAVKDCLPQIDASLREKIRSIDPRDVHVPVRYEDVASYARDGAEQACGLLKDTLEDLLVGVLHEVMEPMP
jgi:hypothetical protein